METGWRQDGDRMETGDVGSPWSQGNGQIRGVQAGCGRVMAYTWRILSLACVLTCGLILAGGPAAYGAAMHEVDLEPNDDFSTAVPIRVPLLNGTGCIDSIHDVDFYTFTLDQSSPLWASVRAHGGAILKLGLYSAKQQLLAEGDTIGTPHVAPGVYFIRVSGFEKDCYDLQMIAETKVPPYS